MAKSSKKTVSAKRPAARRAKAGAKVSAAKVASKKRHAATGSGSKGGSKHGPDTIRLLGKNNRERRLDPFPRRQKEKLLQLRDAMVDSMAGVAQDTLSSRGD